MKDTLLKETTYTADDFDKLFAPVKKAIGHFGKTVSASAKLIGNDVATIIKLNAHWKLRGLGAQKEIMDNWKSNRTKHMKTIYENQNAALESLGPDKWTVMAMSPSTYWGIAAYRGTGELLSKNTREMVGEYGAGSLPIIGALFGGPKARGGDPSFWDRLARGTDVDPANLEDSKETLERELTAWLTDKGVKLDGSPPAGKSSSTMMNILYKINDIFLLSTHVRQGAVLSEGEEKQEPKELIEIAEEVVAEMVRKELMNAFSKEREAYLEEHREVFEGVVSSVEKVLELNISLATEQDMDQFVKILDTTVKKHKEFKEIDVEKIKSEFQSMVQKLGNDEKVLKTLREELEKSGELDQIKEGDEQPKGGISEKEKPLFEKHIKKIALDNCKGGFLQTLKEGTTDLYEQTRFAVTDGLQDDTIKNLEKDSAEDEIAMQFIGQIKEFQKRLDEVMSKIQN